MSSRMRKTKGQTGNRRSHHSLDEQRLSKEDGVYHLRHRASLQTGTYRGREVIDVRSKRQKQLERAREKARSRGDDPETINADSVETNQELKAGNN
ncbi:MAG: 50S ribosomal protein L32 [Candidatus Paceibacterota bacterium]